MNRWLKRILAVAAVAIASQATAQITFYEHDGYQGRTFTTERDIRDLQRFGFNDMASSAVVRGERWEVCEFARFEGRCIVLRPGSYPSLGAMGLNDRVTSVRAVGRDERIPDNRYAVVPVAPVAPRPGAQVTFYEHDGFQGRSFSTDRDVADFSRMGFNDFASSVVVQGERWEVCDDSRYNGRCVVLRPGRYPSLGAMGLNDRVSSVRVVGGNDRIPDNRFAPLPPVDIGRPPPQLTLYEHDGYQGQAVTADREIGDLGRIGFNDKASSVDVRGESWELCEDARFAGRCVVLRPGRYPSLGEMRLNDRVSSVRPVGRGERAEEGRNPVVTAPDFRRRREEQLFEASVISARAVVGTPEQRCWVEREQVVQDQQGAPNVPGAIAGALIGGILGHQIGGGGGRDAATAVGVVGGAAIGANVGRDGSGQQVVTQDVQRCDRPVARARPEYWDVRYVFRGQEHRVQMSSPPGPTVTVNANGEPRV